MALFEFINRNLKWIALIAIACIVMLILRQCTGDKDLAIENQRLAQANQILNGNMQVMQDTVKFWKDVNGNNLSSISILTADKAMLTDQFSSLHAKYEKVVGKSAEDSKMIAYLNSQIQFRDTVIAQIKAAGSKSGTRIINDSTIRIEVGKEYDANNSYTVSGKVQTSIKNDKITGGSVDIETAVKMAIELAISRDKETGIARITTKTAFPAKISMNGITQIENEINKRPSSYLGIGVFGGYGATLQLKPTLAPMIGVGIYYSPSWLTIKLYKK
jgi:hypothetical protein